MKLLLMLNLDTALLRNSDWTAEIASRLSPRRTLQTVAVSSTDLNRSLFAMPEVRGTLAKFT